MVWISAPSAPRRSQWDETSGTFENSQKYNCGPAGASMVAGYYRDVKLAIEQTRRLVTDSGHPTTYQQQADMLTKRGISSVLVDVQSWDHLKRLLLGGRRPILLAIEMGRVPLEYRGYLFEGWHTVSALKIIEKNNYEWLKANDSNFRDPRTLRRLWPKWVVEQAFLDNWQSWAIVPHEPKKLRVEFRSGVRGVNLYDEPGSRKVYADVKAHGIYRHSDGKRLAAHGHNFEFVRYSPTKEYMVLRSFGHTLYAKSKNLHFVKVAQ